MANANYTKHVGKTFHNLEVLEFVGTRNYGIKRTRRAMLYRCRCRLCGTICIVLGGNLTTGHSTSCGCTRQENARQAAITHGMSKWPEYKIWTGIIKRCYTPTFKFFHNYGGRGVVMCSGIRNSFPLFLKVVGRRPEKRMDIDRIENDHGYNCGECDECKSLNRKPNLRWTTRKANSDNRRSTRWIEHDGRRMCLSDWAREKGIGIPTLYLRIYKSKWTIHDALETPVGGKR